MTSAEWLRPVEDDLTSIAMSLARRLHRGATLWCVSPSEADHARALADRFARSSGGGEPGPSAVALPADGLVAALRSRARAGDVVVMIADGTEPQIRELARRAPAWDLTTVWIGAGERPTPGSADLVFWLDDAERSIDADLDLDELARRLSELTHLALADPGVGDIEVVEGAVCVTCADEGQLAEVVELHPDGFSATVRVAGELRDVDTSLIDPPAANDLLLIHAGSVLQNLDAAVEGTPVAQAPTGTVASDGSVS